MYEHHQKLKDARKEGRRLNQGFDNLQERLDQAITKNDRLEQDVKDYKEREKHLQKITFLEKKRPWVVSTQKEKLTDVYIEKYCKFR